MVRLSDFVEAVLREVAAARIKATLAGARMAEDFREHSLLAELPIPAFRVDRVEFEVRFAMADVRPPPSERLVPPPERVRKIVDRLVIRLPESDRARKAFDFVPRLGELWKTEGSRRILAALGREPLDRMTLPGIVALCGNLAKGRYLELLVDPRARAPLRRVREAAGQGLPEQVARALRAELQKVLEKAAAEEEKKRPAEAAVELLVTEEELKEAREVSSLRLVLEEEEYQLDLPASAKGDEE